MRALVTTVAFAVVLSAPGLALAQGAMTNGANHAGSISVPAEIDTWTFTADQGDAIVLSIGETVRVPDSNFWPWIRVTGPTGATLVCGNCWGQLATQMAATAPLTGTYTVLVASAPVAASAVGDYVLRLAKSPGSFQVPTGDQGGMITNGANHPGRIEIGDLDMWTFTADQGDALVLTLGEVPVGPGSPDPGFWPWIRVFDPTGDTLVCGNCWGDRATQMAATAPLTGTYTVVVSSAAVAVAAAGDYVLRLATSPGTFQVPADDHGGALINGANHTGRIELADLDMWTFTADQGDALVLTLGEVAVGPGVPDPGFWPWFRVFGPTGATLVCGNCWGDRATQMAATAPLTGTYTVVVASASGAVAAAGDYVLRFAKTPGTFQVPTGDHGGAMANGVSYTGRIELSDLDMWTFTARQGTVITVAIGEVPVGPGVPDPGFWPWIRVFGPTGGTVVCGNCWGNQTAQMSATAPLTGTYTVVVASASVAVEGTGNYNLTVTGATSTSPPTALDDAYTTALNTPLALPTPGVLTNDNSNGGGPMTAELVTSVSSGVLVLGADGGFTFTPALNFVGATSFTYRARNGAGSGNTATVTLTVSETTTALPPTGLYASSITGNTVTLRWTPPPGGLPPTNYVLEGGVNPGEVLASISVGNTNPIYTFVAPTGAFHVRMHTVSGAERSGPSNEIRIFVNVPAVPSAPADLLGMVNGSSVALAWRNTFEGGAPGGLILDVTGALTTSIALGLADSFRFDGVPDGTYTLALRAVNTAGSSPPSNAVTLTFPGLTCSGPPLPPSRFLAYRLGRTIFVIWDPAASGPAPTSYVLNVTGAFVGTFATPGRTLSGTVGPGSYQLNVAAVNACGASAATPSQSVVVP